VSKAGAKFDPDKTKWFQQQYLRATPDEQLAEMLGEQAHVDLSKHRLASIAHMMKERATFLQDMISEGEYLLNRPQSYDENTIQKKWKEESSEILTKWMDEMKTIEPFSAENLDAAFKSFLVRKGLGVGAVLPLFRLLLTGTGTGPSMFEMSEFFGKEESLERMQIGLNTVNSLKINS